MNDDSHHHAFEEADTSFSDFPVVGGVVYLAIHNPIKDGFRPFKTNAVPSGVLLILFRRTRIPSQYSVFAHRFASRLSHDAG